MSTVKIEADTRMVSDYENEFGLLNAIDSIIRHPTFQRVSMNAKRRAVLHVLNVLREESETLKSLVTKGTP